MRLFALKGTDRLGGAVAAALGTKLDPHEERDFEDGEHKARPLVSVRGKDVYVLHSLAGEVGTSANDKLVKLLLFIATCRENGAARVTAVAQKTSLISDLSDDEQIDLVALMWLGRDDYEAGDWTSVRAQAADARNEHTAEYLIGEPLLADHMAAGLDCLGLSCA